MCDCDAKGAFDCEGGKPAGGGGAGALAANRRPRWSGAAPENEEAKARKPLQTFVEVELHEHDVLAKMLGLRTRKALLLVGALNLLELEP